MTEYKTWKDKNERINASIISEVKKTIKEIVLAMYNKKLSIELISECTVLTKEASEKIVNK